MPKINPPKRTRRSPAHHRSSQQEGEAATRYGGRRVRGSGCGNEKGDARVEGVARIECKTTQKKSFSVNTALIDKIESAALSGGEVPIIEVEFLSPKGDPTHRVAVIPTWALESLLCSTEPKSQKP